LLPEIETARALIVVDAANFGGAPGEVRVFDEEAMDAKLGAAKTSAHELVLADLIGAARLSGSRPERRALVGIAPASVGWGLEPTPEVAGSAKETMMASPLVICPTSGVTPGEILLRRGVSRRALLKYASYLGALMALPAAATQAFAEGLASARRQSVIWLSFQEIPAARNL
jgi:Hydrogenase maturation protease